MVDIIRKKWRSPKEIVMSTIAVCVVGSYCYRFITLPLEQLPEILQDFKEIVLIVVTFYYSIKNKQATGTDDKSV